MKALSLLTAALLPFLSSCEQNTASHSTPPDSTARGAPSSAARNGGSITELGRWSTRGFHEDKDLSGMASWDGVHCLVCSDELRVIQAGIINGTTITGGPAITLLDGDGKEVDAEGVAVARGEGCYYVTGSHGVGKKSGKMQASRCTVFRVPVNPATGEPRGGVDTGSLMPWVQSNPVLGRSAGRSLQENGFNIEGLAHKDGKLWFGVRGPNVNGDAFVIEAGPASLFGGAPQATLHRLNVGPGLGIREIAALRDGFLIVTGAAPSDVGRDDSFALWLWNAGGGARLLGELPNPSGKAEGLYILDDAADHVDVLVIFDGASGGGPKAYRAAKR